MHGFEIGQRESGFYSERTDTQTDVTSSTELVYRFECANEQKLAKLLQSQMMLCFPYSRNAK